MADFQTLAEFFGVETLDLGSAEQQDIRQQTAHVVIDVQREFCDPKHVANRGNKETVRIADVIAKKLTPQFRAAGLKTFLVYFSYNTSSPNVDEDCGGLYKIKPKPEDELIAKSTDSAFDSGTLEERLKKSGIKNIIVSGFNASACVKRTVLGALCNSFKVCVLRDGVGNDNYNTYNTAAESVDFMGDNGACVEDSKTVLGVLRRKTSRSSLFSSLRR